MRAKKIISHPLKRPTTNEKFLETINGWIENSIIQQANSHNLTMYRLVMARQDAEHGFYNLPLLYQEGKDKIGVHG